MGRKKNFKKGRKGTLYILNLQEVKRSTQDKERCRVALSGKKITLLIIDKFFMHYINLKLLSPNISHKI